MRSVNEECLSRLILFGEGSLRRALNEYLMYFHAERPHQWRGNRVLFPSRLSEVARAIALNAGNVSEACSGIMHVPHE